MRMLAVAIAVVSMLAVAAPVHTVLVHFNGANGSNPYSSVVLDGSSQLYGTTYWGGASNNGTLFRYDVGAASLTTLVHFDNAGTGRHPIAELTVGASGRLFGANYDGGPAGSGTLWSYDIGTSVLTTLVAFGGGNGRWPYSGVLIDGYGNLWGTTSRGGAFGVGVLYKYDVAASTQIVAHSFSGGDGDYPAGMLAADALGDFFGVGFYGGTFGAGTIYKYEPSSGTMTNLVHFTGGVDGRYPMRVQMDSAGNLYSTTDSGGTAAGGVLFRFDTITNTLSTLWNFAAPGPWYPGWAPTYDPAGFIYGTTAFGGASDLGTVFKYDLGSGILTTLVEFDGSNGSRPNAALSLDGLGNIYGTTHYGGTFGGGTLFRIELGNAAIPEPGSMFLVPPVVAGFYLFQLTRNSRRRRSRSAAMRRSAFPGAE